MIKRYNQFVKSKINEDMNPLVDMDLTTSDDAEDNIDMVNIDNDSTEEEIEDTDSVDNNNFIEEEEEGGDVYVKNLEKLTELLGGDAKVVDNSVVYNGKKVIFPSETFNSETGTGVFHVDRKKFNSAEEVASYLLEGENKGASNVLDEVEDIQAIEDMELQKESKSYKKTRTFRKFNK